MRLNISTWPTSIFIQAFRAFGMLGVLNRTHKNSWFGWNTGWYIGWYSERGSPRQFRFYLLLQCIDKTSMYRFHLLACEQQWLERWAIGNIPDSKVHGAHLGPTGPRWAPWWPHELCYLGYCWKCHLCGIHIGRNRSNWLCGFHKFNYPRLFEVRCLSMAEQGQWAKSLCSDALNCPTHTRRNNNVIMTSKRRRHVIMTLLLRRVSAGAI